MNKLVSGIAVVVVIAVIAIGAAVYFFAVRDDGAQDQAALPVAAATPVVRADAVVVPVKDIRLAMPRQGMIAEALVSEDDAVEAGQVLARLDTTAADVAIEKAEASLAAAQADLAALRLEIRKERETDDESRPLRLERAREAERQARERYLHLSGANRAPGASVSAEGALTEAKFAAALVDADAAVRDAEEALLLALGVESAEGIPATSETIALVAAREHAVAVAKHNIFNAETALKEANDFADLRGDAQSAVTVANAVLLNAKRQQDVVKLDYEEKLRVAQDAYDDAVVEWRLRHQRYMGIDLTDGELLTPPDELFAQWGADLEFLFDRRNLSFPNDRLEDDPNTRWNELKLFSWLALHPFPSTLAPTCEGVTLPVGMVCLQKEYDDAWAALSVAMEGLDTTRIAADNAATAAASAVVNAEQALDDAEFTLSKLQGGELEADAARAKADLDAANAALKDLLDYVDEDKAAQARAKIVAAKAARDALQPDEGEIALARQSLEDAVLQVSKLERGRDALDEERREARISAADTRIAVAQTSLNAAMTALEDYELRAPFAGTVVAVNVEKGDEVAPRQHIIGIADMSAWELRTSDLDELSVALLSNGDSLEVRFDALPEVRMTGAVRRISRFGENKQGSVTYTAEIILSGSDPRLRWGMTASVRR